MTNSLIVVAKVFSNTLIFFSANHINVFAIFQDRNFNFTLANNLAQFRITGPDILICN